MPVNYTVIELTLDSDQTPGGEAIVQQWYHIMTPFLPVHWRNLEKKSREKDLSKNGLHIRDQRIDISHKFSFEYNWFNINKENNIKKK